MKIVYGAQLSNEQEKVIRDISLECGILYDTARLLFYRNIDSVEKAKRFLNPSARYFFNPFLLKNMQRAVERIKRAKDNGESVLIFGDYDADGICATVVLYHALCKYGITARYVLPEREDGYGININIIKKLNYEQKIDLVITVDCGISDCNQIEELKGLGIEVIVTDHHEPPEVLPDCISINPKIPNQKCFNGLCGAGVAYKLAFALIGKSANSELDYVALATVSDSMELIDENRDILFEGLKLFNSNNLRTSFKLLLGDNNNKITAQTLAFQIAPRINAGGRMGESHTSLALLMSEDEKEIFNLATRLNFLNMERQAKCEAIYKQAKEKIFNENLLSDRILMVYDKQWETGFVGIVAARLVEEFCRPVIIFAGYDGILKGSSRSIDNVNIYETISSAKDILEGFGGHSQAAGVSVKEANFLLLRARLNAYIKENFEFDFQKKIKCDWMVDKEFSTHFASEIEALEPFGVGNRKPTFSVEEKFLNPKPLKNGQHFALKTSVMDMIYFNAKEQFEILSLPLKKTLIFEPSVSVFKGRKNVKGFIKAVITDYSEIENASVNLFESQLKVEDNLNVKEINELPSYREYGTIYAIYDVKNLNTYNLDLPISAFIPENSSTASQIIISPLAVPEGYNRIIYLDKPLNYLNTNIESFCMNVCGYAHLNKVDLSRNTFADIYNYLRNCLGREFTSGAEFYYYDNPPFDAYQFVFCVAVFFELGIFYSENGILKQNFSVKTELEKSVLYKKVLSLRG